MTNLQAIDLLKGLEQSLDDYCELNDEGKTAFGMAITALELFGNAEQLPSAQPERKTGRWVWNPNGMDWNLGAWCCSECRTKAETWWANDEKYNPLMCSGGEFCGNCGARMEGCEVK